MQFVASVYLLLGRGGLVCKGILYFFLDRTAVNRPTTFGTCIMKVIEILYYNLQIFQTQYAISGIIFSSGIISANYC